MTTVIEEMESEQRQHNEVMLHNEKICNEGELHIYNKFKALDLKLEKDGNQFCVLFGENLQEGIAGFGDTPHSAILEWGNAMNTETIKGKG